MTRLTGSNKQKSRLLLAGGCLVVLACACLFVAGGGLWWGSREGHLTLPEPLGRLAPSDTPRPTRTPRPTETPGPLECNDFLGCVEVAPGEPIELAAMLALSGPVASLGDDSLGGVRVALAERPELFGHPIDLYTEDSLCSESGGQVAATRLAANPSLVAVIGTNCSGAAYGALPVISDAGLLMCSPSNTHPGLTDPEGGWLPGYFRVSHNDRMQGVLAAQFLYNEIGARRAATIHDGDPYTASLADAFVIEFERLGGRVRIQQAINVGDTDIRRELNAIADMDVQALYFPVFEPEANYLIAQAGEIAGLEDLILIASDGLLSDSFPENTGPNVVGMFLTGRYVSGPTYDRLLSQWRTHIGGVPPSSFHAYAFDCTNLILHAIEQAAQVGPDGSLLIGRQALRDAFHSIQDFPGVSGHLSCGPFGDCSSFESLAVFQITQNELTGSWPPPVYWQVPRR